MSYSKSPANISVIEYKHGAMDMEAFASIKEMVQHFLTENARIAPDHHGWASKEHLEALEETQELLNRTVRDVRREYEQRTGDYDESEDGEDD